MKRPRFCWVFQFVLLAFPIQAVAQLPEDRLYPDIDAKYLNLKLKEVASRGLIKKWSLSKDEDVLTIEMTESWDSMASVTRLELTRRLLSIFGYYIASRDARQWNFTVVLEREGTKLAEDRGVWWQKGKNPELYQ